MNLLCYRLYIITLFFISSIYYTSLFSILLMTWGECVDCDAYDTWILTSISGAITCSQILIGVYILFDHGPSNLVSIYDSRKYIRRSYLMAIINVALIGLNIYNLFVVQNKCPFELDNMFCVLLFINIAMGVIFVLFFLSIVVYYKYYNTEPLL